MNKLTVPTITVEIWIAMADLAKQNQTVHYTVCSYKLANHINKLFGDCRKGVAIHISQHCVAQKKLNTGYNKCFLTEVGRGRRRLYLPSDPIHKSRLNKRDLLPREEDLPVQYRYLLDWYLQNKNNPPKAALKNSNILEGLI